MAGKQDGPSLIIDGPPRLTPPPLRIAKYAKTIHIVAHIICDTGS